MHLDGGMALDGFPPGHAPAGKHVGVVLQQLLLETLVRTPRLQPGAQRIRDRPRMATDILSRKYVVFRDNYCSCGGRGNARSDGGNVVWSEMRRLIFFRRCLGHVVKFDARTNIVGAENKAPVTDGRFDG